MLCAKEIYDYEVIEDYEDDVEEVEDIDIDEYVELPNITLDEAVIDYRNGVEDAFELIYGHYKPIFDRVAGRRNDEDLVQELSIILIHCIKHFKEDSSNKFNTFFWHCAQNHIRMLHNKGNALKRKANKEATSIYKSISTDDKTIELIDVIKDNDSNKGYNTVLNKTILRDNVFRNLKQDEVIACKMIMDGYTLEEIGKRLNNITAPAVYVKLKRIGNKKEVRQALEQLRTE